MKLWPMTAIQVLTALHHGEGAAVALARMADRWQECGAILAADLPAKWPSLAPEFARDSYFSLASTYEQKSTSRISELGLPLWSRKAERLRWLNAVVIDLDHHADKNFSAEALLERFCC